MAAIATHAGAICAGNEQAQGRKNLACLFPFSSFAPLTAGQDITRSLVKVVAIGLPGGR